MANFSVIKALLLSMILLPATGCSQPTATDYDLVVLGGTPGGIMTAVAAARFGCSVLILNRGEHIGGLPANGLGATDIGTRGATSGLFDEFVGRVKSYYQNTYGENSPQVKATDGGYYFEPHVAELVFNEMLAEHSNLITVLTRRQFDALPERVELDGSALSSITVTNLESGARESYSGKIFADATYEGDLAAAAGAPFRLGREGKAEFGEPMAGRLYKYWGGDAQDGSTGLADNAVQAYNFRLCLTQNQDDMVSIPKPDDYDRTEYLSLAEDIQLGRTTKKDEPEGYYKSMHQISSMVDLPNEKFDGNNHHQLFLSTDLPEENWPWPTSGWDWRDKFAKRLRSYTLGLLWFVQHDQSVPEELRKECISWGMARSEYADNGHFPREVYVREGRRIVGEYLFTAHDALSMRGKPGHVTSITASHYNLDSHAVRKREPGRVHLDGFFSYSTTPYTVPYGVIVPRKVDALLTPVPVSGTHIGFSTLRMEPCWMAMGQAAGTAVALAIELGVQPRRIPVHKLQQRLLEAGAVLIHFEDAAPGEEHYEALQFFALRGFLQDQRLARLGETVEQETANRWIAGTGTKTPAGYAPGKTSRGQLLDMLYLEVKDMPGGQVERILAEW